MLVFRPVSLLEKPDEKSLSFSFEEDIDYQDDDAGDESEKNGEICKFFLKGNCNRDNCDFRHTRGEKAVVCKHWLRGLCKKDKLCEFLHEFDLSKMPICHFFSTYGTCSNEECPYRHVNGDEQQTDCAWYARGFCKHGPKCRHRHIKKEACIRYLTGFCPKGPKCEFGHPKYELPEDTSTDQNRPNRQNRWVCRRCNQTGHRDFECRQGNPGMEIDESPQPKYQGRPQNQHRDNNNGKPRRALADVLCFKCMEKGHYANKCPNKAVPRDHNSPQQHNTPREHNTPQHMPPRDHNRDQRFPFQQQQVPQYQGRPNFSHDGGPPPPHGGGYRNWNPR